MAKLIVDLPRDFEAKITQKEKGSQLVIEPSFISGTKLAPCLYLTSQGEGGMERRVIIMLNGNTGWPETRRVKSGSQQCQFDLPPEEYAKRGVKDDEPEEPEVAEPEIPPVSDAARETIQ
jgi:hypothetical protein